MTIEDYINYHNEHCPFFGANSVCACWLPEKREE